MPRPEKVKRICGEPKNKHFYTDGIDLAGEPVAITNEEYEAVRLIDYVGLTQEQCALQMHVARTTVQKLYTDARYKIAKFLISGSDLTIAGGNYIICENSQRCCQRHNCEGSSRCTSCEHRMPDCMID